MVIFARLPDESFTLNLFPTGIKPSHFGFFPLNNHIEITLWKWPVALITCGQAHDYGCQWERNARYFQTLSYVSVALITVP